MKKKMHTKVSDRGQVSVPADIRVALGIEPGTMLEWELSTDGSARVSVSRTRLAQSAVSLVGFVRKYRKPRCTDEWFK